MNPVREANWYRPIALWSRNRDRMKESAFWTTHMDDAIGALIAPRFRISFSSLNEKPSLKLDQISATQITVAAVVPIVCPMIAPLTPAPAERMATIAIRLNAGRAASSQA